jgi:dihydrolipoamide dehydrogenase
MDRFDVVVIGGGPGGYPAAIRAAQLGARVALIEKEALGGACLNWGCIPTKALIACSDLYARMTKAADMGLTASKPGYDYPAMSKRKDAIVARLRGGVAQLLKANRVTVLEGVGSFLGRNRIGVASAASPAEPERSGEQIEAGAVIVATGAESAMPGFLPRDPRVVESRRFLERTELPASLVVLGGGVIGCEFACMAAQLGARVTVVELLEDILVAVDPDVRRELRRHMEKALGIRVLTGRPLEKVTAGTNGVSGTAGDAAIAGDLLLVAVGRRPVTKDLALDKAGLETSELGFLEADAFCRTKAETVFAVGDVTGKAQLAHAATAQGIAAAENAVSGKPVRAETLAPACIFTAPEIGSVGVTEQQAAEKGLAVRTGRFGFAALGKALAIGEPAGFVKWVADAQTDRLLGAHAVGPHATELIAEAAVAIRAELTARELGRTIHCHPTLAESWAEAAHAVHGECIHAAPKRQP